jgi:hypothetical protein
VGLFGWNLEAALKIPPLASDFSPIFVSRKKKGGRLSPSPPDHDFVQKFLVQKLSA